MNMQKHGVSLAEAVQFDLVHALTVGDDRETRYKSIGYLGTRLHVLVYTCRENANQIRAISLRKANRKEREDYGQSY